MSTEIVEELVMAKKALEAENHQLLTMLGVAITNGKKDTPETEVRMTKASLTKMIGRTVTVTGLKTGGVVVTVKKTDG